MTDDIEIILAARDFAQIEVGCEDSWRIKERFSKHLPMSNTLADRHIEAVPPYALIRRFL